MPTLQVHFENGDVHEIRAEGYVTVRELMYEYLRARNVTGDEKGRDWTTLHKRTNMALELDRTLDQHGLRDGDELYISRRGNTEGGADLKVHVTSPDGKNHHAEMPPDTATEELLKDLIEVWKLPVGNWELVDQQTGKKLDSKKTLAENGMVTGRQLSLKQPGSPGVKSGNPCWRCQADVRGMRYCNKCGADQQQAAGFKSEAVEPEGKRRQIEISSFNEKTQGIYHKKLGLDPVVGWLVCVDGSERGRDYPIRGENNFIGRSEKMDICISGDEGISRENHAVITFDPKTSLFKLSPGDARGIVYLNSEAVYSPVDLTDHDQIQLGNSQFRFIGFCGDRFQWT